MRLDEGRSKASAAAVAAQWFAQFDDPDLAAEDEAAGGGDDPETLNPAGPAPPPAGPRAKRRQGGPDLAASVRAEAGVGGPGSVLGRAGGLATRVSTARSASAAATGFEEAAGAEGAASGAAAGAAQAADGGFEEVPMEASSSDSDDEGGDGGDGAEESGSDAGLLDLDDQGRAEV